jgi:hypothetical protein
MDRIELKTIVVNTVNSFLEDLSEKMIKKKIKSKIESALKDDELRLFLNRNTEKIIEEMCNKNTRPELLRIIKRYTRPQIIYVHEPPETPQQLKPFEVQEYFMASIGPCIYFLCREERIVYIGQSVNLAQRISQHIQCKNFDRIFYFNVLAEDLNRIEAELIDFYDPELNRTKAYTKDRHERQRR